MTEDEAIRVLARELGCGVIKLPLPIFLDGPARPRPRTTHLFYVRRAPETVKRRPILYAGPMAGQLGFDLNDEEGGEMIEQRSDQPTQS